MRPSFDTRYVTLVLRVRRGHVRMAHLRARVRIVRIVGGGYVLHRGEGGLKFVISDYVRLCSILPRSFAYRLRFRAVPLARSLHLLVVSVEYPRGGGRGGGGGGRRRYMDRWGHLGAKILVQLVALHLALLKVQREIEADACQRPEPVQLALLDRQTVPDLDVPEIDSRLVLMLVLVLVLVLGGRLGRATDSQLLVVMVHGGARLRLIPLIRVVLSAGRSGRGRWRESLVRGGRGGRADPALGRVGPLDRARARVLLLQRPGHVESHVALAPRRRPLPPRRPVLLPPPGLILVVRVLAFVDHAQPISLLDERLLVVVRQQPPKFAQSLGQLRVVKLRILIGEYSPRGLSPHHKRVHRSLHVGCSFVTGTLGGNRYQGPIVSLKNFGNRGADSLASVRRNRAAIHISRFSIVAAPIATPIVDVGVPVYCGGTVGGIGDRRGGARRNGTRSRLSHNVVHLPDFFLRSTVVSEWKWEFSNSRRDLSRATRRLVHRPPNEKRERFLPDYQSQLPFYRDG